MHSYNLGIFSIGEQKIYTMKPELSYERIRFIKDCKNYNIKSKVYRKWVRGQQRKLKRKGNEIRRNNRPNFMGSSLTYVRKHPKRDIKEEMNMFILLAKRNNERKILRRSRQIKQQLRLRSNC